MATPNQMPRTNSPLRAVSQAAEATKQVTRTRKVQVDGEVKEIKESSEELRFPLAQNISRIGGRIL